MADFTRFFIPLYFILFFTVSFLGISFRVARQINKNPNVLPKDSSAYALVGRYFKLILLALFIYSISLALFPEVISGAFIIHFMDVNLLKYIGLILMISAFFWVVVAQLQMKDSWRIGIDTETKTTLVTHGLFGISRNPVFLGMTVSLLGFFLISPTLIVFLFLLVGSILMQIQIRLEEEDLNLKHGHTYLVYKKKVGRMLRLY